ncbi:response regulator [Candidatus Pacearchaeota archaeon]|nr:response regulator [Candidatus Pacearchaeota archaeon]
MIKKLIEKGRQIFSKKEDGPGHELPQYEPIVSDAGQIMIGVLEYYEEMRKLYARYLEGYSYFITHDHEQFMVQLDSFDAVILDCREPDINGFNLASLIKEKKPVPIIICTANGSLEANEEFKVSKADACLIKPVSQEELIDCLNRGMVKTIPEPVVKEKKPAKRGRKPLTFLDIAEKRCREFEESNLSKAEYARRNKISLSNLKNEFKIASLPESAKKIVKENTDCFKKSFFEHICKLDEQSIIDICNEISEQGSKGNYYALNKVMERTKKYFELKKDS